MYMSVKRTSEHNKLTHDSSPKWIVSTPLLNHLTTTGVTTQSNPPHPRRCWLPPGCRSAWWRGTRHRCRCRPTCPACCEPRPALCRTSFASAVRPSPGSRWAKEQLMTETIVSTMCFFKSHILVTSRCLIRRTLAIIATSGPESGGLKSAILVSSRCLIHHTLAIIAASIRESGGRLGRTVSVLREFGRIRIRTLISWARQDTSEPSHGVALQRVMTKPFNANRDVLILFDEYIGQHISVIATQVKFLSALADFFYFKWICTMCECCIFSDRVRLLQQMKNTP